MISFQIDIGDAYSITQPTICQLLKKISLLIEWLSQFVKFPSHQEVGRVKRNLYSVAGFPGVIWCISCTHIPIQNPHREGGEHFQNRKGYFSLNVQW